jgi:hypothetical protein
VHEDRNELRRDAERQLEWEPSVDETAIDGIVTLTDEVGSHGKQWKAERTNACRA